MHCFCSCLWLVAEQGAGLGWCLQSRGQGWLGVYRAGGRAGSVFTEHGAGLAQCLQSRGQGWLGVYRAGGRDGSVFTEQGAEMGRWVAAVCRARGRAGLVFIEQGAEMGRCLESRGQGWVDRWQVFAAGPRTSEDQISRALVSFFTSLKNHQVNIPINCISPNFFFGIILFPQANA